MLLGGANPMDVIIDTDMGWDDVLAISYLMKCPNVNILGVTVTGCGETHLTNGVEIAQRLLKAGNIDGAVCAGASVPSQYNHHFPEPFRKSMDDVSGNINKLPKVNEPCDPRMAWEFMRDKLDEVEGQITILSLGGFTNIARLFELEPAAKLENIKDIVVMGGAISVDGNVAALNNSADMQGGNTNNQGPNYASNHYAEWNIFLDPLAAKKVLFTSVPMTWVPLDACNDIILQPIYADLITSADPVAVFVKGLLDAKTKGPDQEAIPLPIFDPLAAMVMSDRLRRVTYQDLTLDIVTEETNQDNMCGQTYITRTQDVRPVKVAMGVSQLEFQEVWQDVFNHPVVEENPKQKNVGILVFDNVEAQDLAGVFEVLGAARMKKNESKPQFNVFTVGKSLEPIKSTAGPPVPGSKESVLEIKPQYTLEQHPKIDILLIVGGQAIDDILQSEAKEPVYTNWIKKVDQKAEYVAGFCSGVMLLAATGLLKNLKVTTHHTRFVQLQQLSDTHGYGLSVMDTRGGENYIHESQSKYMTSGGVHCAIAQAVHIVELVQGIEAAQALCKDVLEYTIPRGRLSVPKDFPQPRHMDPRDFVLGFSHINVIVADLKMMEEATGFYKRVLGFEEAWTLWLPPETNQHFAADAGFDDCKVLVRFLYHPNAQIHLELMMYEFPKGEQEIKYHKTNDVGGIRHVALEVSDAVKAYNWLKDQEGVTMIKPVREGYGPPQKLSPDPQTFFYWLDPYGVQWEFEQGRPMERVINGIVG